MSEHAGRRASAGLAAEEADLLTAVSRGDHGRALEALYDRYERRLYGLGLRLLGDQGLAEELVQETFVRLWRAAGTFDAGRGTVSAMIFTIARRLAVDLWRRPSSRPFEPAPEEMAGRDPVESVVTGLAVRDALDSLSAQHREMLEMTHFRGMKQTEIAEKLRLPLGTVKTRTYHALRALKRALEDRGVDD